MASALEIVQTFLDVDFEDAVIDTTAKTITTPNKAANPAANVVWTYDGNSDISVFSTDASYPTQNSTSYISCAGTKKAVGYNFDMPTQITAASGNVIYVDIRIRREYLLDDDAAITFQDSTAKPIFKISYKSARIPQLIADATYGTDTNTPADTIVSYPYETGWRYVRAIINFGTKTFELYQGKSLRYTR